MKAECVIRICWQGNVVRYVMRFKRVQVLELNVKYIGQIAKEFGLNELHAADDFMHVRTC